MKNIFIITLSLVGQAFLFAQPKQENASFTVAEFRGGYGVSLFGAGLKEKYEAGNFSTSAGGLASLAAYHKFKKINHVTFGIKYKSLGAAPANGDNGQEMFFNYWGAAATTKYFPFNADAKKGFYLQADYFFVSQFTQKYRNKLTKTFDHQFAIGSGLAFGFGYDFPIGNGKTMLTIGVEYETNSRRGKVTSIGNKNFNSANVGVMTGIKF